jgi:hypothetical protein
MVVEEDRGRARVEGSPSPGKDVRRTLTVAIAMFNLVWWITEEIKCKCYESEEQKTKIYECRRRGQNVWQPQHGPQDPRQRLL